MRTANKLLVGVTAATLVLGTYFGCPSRTASSPSREHYVPRDKIEQKSEESLLESADSAFYDNETRVFGTQTNNTNNDLDHHSDYADLTMKRLFGGELTEPEQVRYDDYTQNLHENPSDGSALRSVNEGTNIGSYVRAGAAFFGSEK